MKARGSDFFPGFDPEEKREPAAENKCSVCGRGASFGFRLAGWEGFRSPTEWRCFAHRIERAEDDQD